MRKHVLIEVVLVLIISGVVFWNVCQQQKIVTLQGIISTLKKDNVAVEEKNKKLISENRHLSNQVKNARDSLIKEKREYTNSGTNIDLNSEYINIVTKVFEANLNFTPKNFEDKKEEVSQYLSDELKEEYFGQQRKSYQNANGTTSQLESLEIYPKEIQNNDLEGVAMVQYKSKQVGQKWTKDMNIFKVVYDIRSKKISKIVNVGSGYSD